MSDRRSGAAPDGTSSADGAFTAPGVTGTGAVSRVGVPDPRGGGVVFGVAVAGDWDFGISGRTGSVVAGASSSGACAFGAIGSRVGAGCRTPAAGAAAGAGSIENPPSAATGLAPGSVTFAVPPSGSAIFTNARPSGPIRRPAASAGVGTSVGAGAGFGDGATRATYAPPLPAASTAAPTRTFAPSTPPAASPAPECSIDRRRSSGNGRRRDARLRTVRSTRRESTPDSCA